MIKNNILITGGAGFLSKAIIKNLKDLNNSLILVDINYDELKNIKSLYKNFYESIFIYKCDLSNISHTKKLFQKISSKHKINILINNAAYKSPKKENFYKSFEEYDFKTYKEIMSVNIDAPFVVSQIIGHKMIQNKIKGSIINISSIYGVISPDPKIYKGSFYKGMEISSPAVYTVSKAALHGLSIYLAAYWGKHNIRVNTVSPGGILDGHNATFKKNYSNKVPMERMANIDDIPGIICFLISPESSYITGQNFLIDGGMSII